MRVIVTELYFDAIKREMGRPPYARRFFRGFEREKEETEGIAFAWFSTEGEVPRDIQNYKWFQGEEIGHEDIPRAIDIILRDEDEFYGRRMHPEASIKNQAIVEYVLDQPIVIEQSPPVGVPLRKLLAKTNSPILLGAYLGYEAAGDSPLMMYITVPGGIIIVMSSIGIAVATASGLHKKISKLFNKK